MYIRCHCCTVRPKPPQHVACFSPSARGSLISTTQTSQQQWIALSPNTHYTEKQKKNTHTHTPKHETNPVDDDKVRLDSYDKVRLDSCTFIYSPTRPRHVACGMKKNARKNNNRKHGRHTARPPPPLRTEITANPDDKTAAGQLKSRCASAWPASKAMHARTHAQADQPL